MELIFTYGTLQDSAIQIEIIGRELGDGQADSLRGYKMALLKGIHETYNIIQPHTGSVIEGRVYEVTQEELDAIDAYEGDAYIRVSATLMSNTHAWVYRDNPRSPLQSQIVPVDD